MKRRQVLRGLGYAGLLPLIGSLGGLLSSPAHARVAAAFEAKTARDALAVLFEEARIEDSDALELIAPDVAEDGSAVQIEIRSTLGRVDSLAVIATDNPRPLAASYQFTRRSGLPVDLRIRLAGSQEVVVIARTDDRLFSTRKLIQVTIGACGV